MICKRGKMFYAVLCTVQNKKNVENDKSFSELAEVIH